MSIEHIVYVFILVTQALEEAKQGLKFLLVYLHGDDHEDTNAFCQYSLSNESLVQYIDENFVLWACNINSGEGYRGNWL